MPSRISRDLNYRAASWSWSKLTPALTCLWPRPVDHFALRLDSLVRKHGLLSSSLAASGSLMLPEARRIFHSFVVQSEAPRIWWKIGVWVDDNHVLRGRWKRLPWSGGPRQTRCRLGHLPPSRMVEVVDNGLTFAAEMNIPVCDARVCALPSLVREVS
jgi:hypothetical protein